MKYLCSTLTFVPDGSAPHGCVGGSDGGGGLVRVASVGESVTSSIARLLRGIIKFEDVVLFLYYMVEKIKPGRPSRHLSDSASHTKTMPNRSSMWRLAFCRSGRDQSSQRLQKPALSTARERLSPPQCSRREVSTSSDDVFFRPPGLFEGVRHIAGVANEVAHHPRGLAVDGEVARSRLAELDRLAGVDDLYPPFFVAVVGSSQANANLGLGCVNPLPYDLLNHAAGNCN